MAVPQPEFTCLCGQKTLVFEDRERAQQAQDQRLADSLRQLAPAGEPVILSGGGIVAQGTSVCQTAGYCAALLGRIDNKSALVDKYLTNVEAVGSPNKNSSAVLKDAEVVCLLYKKFGRVVPQKLRGSFTFVLFDQAQGRVLAAVSPTSKALLIQARTADNGLLVTSREASRLPAHSHSAIQIPPGSMKYGWSSEPQRYAGAQDAAVAAAAAEPSTAAAAAAIAREALHGLETQAEAPPSPTADDSEGADAEGRDEPQSPVPKKTRRGKRAGKNQKLRAEQMMLQRLSSDTRRASLDAFKTGSLSHGSSLTSRADEQSWWRTNTPRTSLDASGGFASRLSTQSDRGSTCALRSGMSPTAPVFVPGFFGRQSVPALEARPSALSFANVPACIRSGGGSGGDAGAIQAPHAISRKISGGEPGASPFNSQPPQKPPGKADAAWEEEQTPSATARSGARTAAADTVAEPFDSRTPIGAAAETLQEAAAAAPLARVKVRSSESLKGASPDGSPCRPPRGPTALRYLLKAMRRRPSQADVRLMHVTAEPGGAHSRARSSSHGNLAGLMDVTEAGGDSISDEKAWLALGVPQRDGDPHRAATAHRPVADPPGGFAASWLVRKTRSVFGKSKSCTSLVDIDRPALQGLPLSGVRAA